MVFFTHEPSRTITNRKRGKKIFKRKFVKEPEVLLVWFVVILLNLISCSRQSTHDNLLIAVSIPPQAWFVSEIAGDKADVLILVPPGQNPHNYEPTPKQIQNLSKASAWILSGAEFEISLRPKIEKLFPNLLIIDGTEGVEFRYLTEHEHHDCDDDDHDHDLNIDRHTWLGYENANLLTFYITHSLCLLDKDNEEYYYEKFSETYEKIYYVFYDIKNELAPLHGKSVFVYHPSFGYFLDTFGIIQEAVEMGGKEPTPRQLNDLMERVKQEKPAAIFVQKQFPVNAAKTIADTIGAQVIELDPLAQDWLENIKHMGQELKKVIK